MDLSAGISSEPVPEPALPRKAKPVAAKLDAAADNDAADDDNNDVATGAAPGSTKPPAAKLDAKPHAKTPHELDDGTLVFSREASPPASLDMLASLNLLPQRSSVSNGGESRARPWCMHACVRRTSASFWKPPPMPKSGLCRVRA
jgi:hypothetical protein